MDKSEQIIDSHVILRALLESSTENMVILSPKHEVLVLSKTMYGFVKTNFGVDIIEGDNILDFLPSSNCDIFLSAFQRTLEGETTSVERHVKGLKNTSLQLEYKMSPVYGFNNVLQAVLLKINHTESEPSTLLSELQHRTEVLEAIFDNTGEAIVLVDKDYKVLEFNSIAKNRLLKNIQKEIFVGADFRDFLYAKPKDLFYKMFADALAGKSSEVEVPSKNIHDEEYWFQANMFPSYNRNGVLIGVAIYTHSIDVRKKAELALQESEEKFRKIVDVAPVPIIIANKDMQIVLANTETERVFGYKSSELTRKNIEDLIPERFNSTHIEHQNDCMKNSGACRMGMHKLASALKKDGKEIIIEASLNTFQLNNEQYILAIIQDVTQRVKSEKQIANQLERLKAISWQQSHEVRKPVANIMCVNNILKVNDDITFEERENLLKLLYEATEELDVIIHKIVSYANSSE